jgi:succinate dehydrogenase / fumarate reductase iron-sulfur subunit
MEYRFRIQRFDPQKDERPRFRDFRIDADGKTSVLEALTRIREEQDGTLAFRHSCREAVCGSCAMAINGRPELACRTLLGPMGSRPVIVEPLPAFEVLKDLVVDLEPFFEAYRRIEPFVNPEAAPPEKGYRIGEREMDRITPFINCILCGCCHAACPVVSRDERYPGPAALAKLYRFVADPRDRRPFDRWSGVNAEPGAWGCDTVFRCNEVCPREVRPADGIGALRRKLIAGMIRKVLRLKR